MYDNDSYLLKINKKDRRIYHLCTECDVICNKRSLILDSLPEFKVKRKKFNLSSTYDGFNIASAKFKNLYELSNWKGLEFYNIPKTSEFCVFECISQVSINKTMRPIEFESKCNRCGCFIGIYGNRPLYINKSILNKLLPDTFYRSNLEFGYDFEQNYSLFASEYIVNKMLENHIITNSDIFEVKTAYD